MNSEKRTANRLPKGALMLFWIRRKSISPVLLLAACKAFTDDQRRQEEQQNDNGEMD